MTDCVYSHLIDALDDSVQSLEPRASYEDVGIGSYEYWGYRGCDSRYETCVDQEEGQEEVTVLLDHCPSAEEIQEASITTVVVELDVHLPRGWREWYAEELETEATVVAHLRAVGFRPVPVEAGLYAVTLNYSWGVE